MQQNQNNQISILTDNKLREQIALKICEELNKYIKEEKKDYKPEELYSTAEVIAWVNNPNAMKRHLDVIKKNDILSKTTDKMSQYKADSEYIQVVQKNGDYGPSPDPEYKGSGSSGRTTYMFMDLNDTHEADNKNQQYCNYGKNDETAKIFLYEILDKMEEQDLKVLTPITLEEIYNQSDEAHIASELGFVMGDQINLHKDNPKFFKMMDENRSFYQRGEKTALDKYFNSCLSTLIPIKNSPSLGVVIAKKSKELNDFIQKEFGNIKEFSESYEKHRKPSGFVADPYDLLEMLSRNTAIFTLFNQNKKLRKMIDKGIFTKGLGTKYCFKDANGNIVSFYDVEKAFDGKKLRDGYKKVEFTPKEIEENETIRKGVFNRAKALEMYFLYQKYEKGELPKDKDKYIDTLVSFANAFKLYIDINRDLTDPLQKANSINTFMEENRELVKAYDDLERDRIAELDRPITEDKAAIDQSLTTLSYENKDLNYYGLRDKALDKAGNLLDTDLGNIVDAYPYQKELNEILNSGYSRSVFVHEKLENLKPYISKDDAINAIGLISDINKADEKYKKRNIFARLWYNNSHNAMMETRNNLINKLSDRGFDKNTLEKLGKDTKIDVANFTRNSFKAIDDKQKIFESEIKEFHNVYIEQPNNELKATEELLKEYVKIKDGAKKLFDQVTQRCFEEFIKGNENYRDKLKDIQFLELDKFKDKTINKNTLKDDFKNWRNTNKDNNDIVKLFYDNRENYDRSLKDCAEIENEIKARNTCINKGVKFDLDAYKKQKEADKKPFNERLNEDFNKKEEVVKDGKRIEANDLYLKKEKGMGKE